jgi:hypothetical protein
MNIASPTGPNGGSWRAINGTASSMSTSGAHEPLEVVDFAMPPAIAMYDTH